MLYELILINEIEQRAKIIFLSVHKNGSMLEINYFLFLAPYDKNINK